MSSPSTPSCVDTRTNILLYTDAGAGQESIRHTMEQLKAHVDLTQYTIIPILSSYILQEWDEQAQAKTALLIIPGGADLPYCADLFGAGCDRIRSYVAAGGAYMGLCAGAYFGTNYCQFEKGHKYLEVCGPRQLAFFPGRAVGCTFPGFDYRSQRGARATPIAFRTDSTSDEWQSARIYYNGGCHFIPDNSDEMPIPPQHIVKLDTTNSTETSTNPTTTSTTTTTSTSESTTPESTCESTSHSTCSSSPTPFTVVGWYTDISPVVPAMILSHYGSGRALLSGVHPEFAAPALSRVDVDTEHPCQKIMLPEEKGRITLWRSMLQQCGIRLN